MEEAGDIFDKLEIRYHLGTSESGDVCKNSIKRGEAMTGGSDGIRLSD